MVANNTHTHVRKTHARARKVTNSRGGCICSPLLLAREIIFLYIKRRYNGHCTFAPALILSDYVIKTKPEVQSAHTLRFSFGCLILCAWGRTERRMKVYHVFISKIYIKQKISSE